MNAEKCFSAEVIEPGHLLVRDCAAPSPGKIRRIIEAASRVFARGGYQGDNAKQLADEAAVAVVFQAIEAIIHSAVMFDCDVETERLLDNLADMTELFCSRNEPPSPQHAASNHQGSVRIQRVRQPEGPCAR